MNKGRYYHLFHAILWTITAAAMLILSSCTSLEKATQVATKSEDNAQHVQTAITAKYKYLTAVHCDDVFPVAESEVIPGEEKVEVHSEQQEPVAVPCEDARGNPVKEVKCPGATTVYRTVTRVDTIRLTNTRREYALQAAINRKEAERLDEKKGRLQEKERADKSENQNKKHWWGWSILAVLVIGLGAARLFLPKL